MTMTRLTKTFVDRLSNTEKGHTYHFDSELKGFGVRVGKQSKVFFAESRVNGRTVRVKIGSYGAVTSDQARKKAKSLLGAMAENKNPNAQKRADKSKAWILPRFRSGKSNPRRNSDGVKTCERC